MLLSGAQQSVRDAARTFAERIIAPHAAGWERNGGGIPETVLQQMGEHGYFGLLAPQHCGGSALDYVSYAAIVEEFAAADCGLANLMCVSNSPVTTALRDHGSAEQHQRYLSPLAAGQMRGCFMLTEAAAGSDAAAIATRAEPDAGGFRLHGQKQFVTAGQSAHLALVIAVTDRLAGKRGMSAFLVPTAAPGYRVTRLDDKLGHRNCDTAEVLLDGIAVGREQLLGAPGDGYRIALAYLQGGRIGVAAQALGVARAALEAAIAYAGQRETFGQPIREHQAIGFRLAEMATELTAARQLTLHAAALADTGARALVEASMAKAYASAMAERVCSNALQIHGGYGYTRDCAVEKYYRDARVLSIYEGTNDIQNLVIARELGVNWQPR